MDAYIQVSHNVTPHRVYANIEGDEALRRRLKLADGTSIHIVDWHVPRPVRGSEHSFKYRCAFVVKGHPVLRFDNEAGKGDHMHRGDEERPYCVQGRGHADCRFP